ncbi:hypothetical protein ACQR2B_17395 [Bradyrhizobium oligotrophicum]|uniref:hypothetical protein n=1 Tax=Bradyrhizobium TaxID=374 RepID=UPI003EBA1028
MPENRNPHVPQLLSWHGQSGGGVHVPFQARVNPIGEVIETPLVQRLRSLAAAIAADERSTPRWIFLVGGPGNGKSETVEDFLRSLDQELGLNGALCAVLRQRFAAGGVLPRKIDIVPADLGLAASSFSARVSRVIVVQDATATETALGNAASELAHDLADLLTCPDQPLPVFIACANRGLLARAMNEAFRAYGDNPVTSLLTKVIQASGLGRDTLGSRKQSWPLEDDNRFACWPLDIESLLLADATGKPLERILNKAIDDAQWEVAGRCLDCSSRTVCPFRQNAEWLRDERASSNLLLILRHGELARGQRWNFRDSFSLVAELLVGQWSDFAGASHPCDWVHEAASGLQAAAGAASSALALVMRLYGNAMFRGAEMARSASSFNEKRPVDSLTHPISAELITALSTVAGGGSTKSIRETLENEYARLDPASTTPADSAHPLRSVEDAFCQSIDQGLTATNQALALSPAENLLLEAFDKAEREWDLLARNSTIAIAAVAFLRRLAGLLAKRSLGIRLGYHALDHLLADYEATLRDGGRLAKVREVLSPLLGDAGFSFNLVEIIGQPTAEARSQPLVSLRGLPPGIRTLPAPRSTSTTPGHDMPCVEIADLDYRIPLTFDFYMALQLRKEGCAGSSLPASVRAALDRVRHRYAGDLCRNVDRFIDGRTFVVVGEDQKIGIPAPGSPPGLISA